MQSARKHLSEWKISWAWDLSSTNLIYGLNLAHGWLVSLKLNPIDLFLCFRVWSTESAVWLDNFDFEITALNSPSFVKEKLCLFFFFFFFLLLLLWIDSRTGVKGSKMEMGWSIWMVAKVTFVLTASTPARHDVCGPGWSRLSSWCYFFPEWKSLNITSHGASSGLKHYQVGKALCGPGVRSCFDLGGKLPDRAKLPQSFSGRRGFVRLAAF